MAENPSETRPADQGTPLSAIAAEDVATPISRDEDPHSRKVSLADLSAKGTALYAHEQYEEAAEIFSIASVLQAELNGETAPENAEILFHYGRSLFKVGQSKSDVLGGSAATEKKTASTKTEAPQNASQQGASTTAAAEKDAPKQGEVESGADEKKPLFQFTGDENFDNSSDEEQQEQEEAPEEEDDDLATAFEILDLARVCYQKQLEELTSQEEQGKGKEAAEAEAAATDSPALRHIKERLADTHDCLAEISLENERYPNAIGDGRESLRYKLQLYPQDSEIVAEAHYKLSLALEFASITMSDEDGKNTKREAIDQELRDEASKEMELAIESFKLKLQNKEVEVATMASPEDNDMSRKAISEMKEVIADMEQRLLDLKKDPIDARDILGAAEANVLGGIFGAALSGESAADTQARVEEAKKTATDLSGLVRKKKPVEPVVKPEESLSAADAVAASPATNGKRKAEDNEKEDQVSKKTKVDEPAQEQV